MGFSAVYVHIPFCLQKCNYCDFLSFPGKPQAAVVRQYLDGLKKEFALYWERLNGAIFAPNSNVTIYFGGGTPSLMPVWFIAEVITMVNQAAADCETTVMEITLETNPGTIGQVYLQRLKEAGINRISLGAQSFDDTDLAAMGRLHTAADTKEAVAMCRGCGFDNVSLDLMANLPNQTVEKWLRNLQQAVALGVEHISCYGLHLSEESPWGKAYALDKLHLPDEDSEIAMWQEGRAYLQEMGYLQYEISNFARQGKACRHNVKYWQRENYLGLGLGASSCYGNYRWSNEETLTDYQGTLAKGRLPVAFQEILTDEVVLAEGVFLGLRCTEGVFFDVMKVKYGVEIATVYEKEIKQLEKAGLLFVDKTGMRLSPRGQLLANNVFAAFLPEKPE